MENKKPNALGIVLATVALTGVLLIGVASNSSFEKTFFRITANDEKTYTQVFNAGNAPTDSAEFQESLVTTWGHASYTYKNVKAAEGAHCVLAAGGSITKNEEALDLIGVQVTFEGDLDLLTTFEKDGEESRYDLTSGEVQYLCGNYVEFVANTETKIIDMTLNYACQATFTYAHNFVETERTETNGDDEDRVWECKKCHLTEARVDPEGFNSYRMGEMMVPTTENVTITKATEAVGGVNGAYYVVGDTNTSSTNWNYKIEPTLVSHKPNNTTTRSNIEYYQIAAVSFDIYVTDSTTQIRVGSPVLSTGKHTAVNYNFNTTYNYANEANSHIRVYNQDGTNAESIQTNNWYTFVVDYPDLTNYPANQYCCVEICNIRGSFYYSNVRYWHETPHKLSELTLEWGDDVANQHAGTYADGDIGGRTGVKIYNGSNSWKDQLDFSYTMRTATSGVGSFKDNFYLVKYNRIKEFIVDIYLPAGTSVRLQSNHCNASNAIAQETSVLAAGKPFAELSGKIANSHVTVTYETEQGTQTLNYNDTAPVDTWFTVKFDVSFWKNMRYNGASYTNISLIAPTGSIGLDNVTYTRYGAL